ncbi:MAG: LysR family transcriptional regulator [Deltaproteobacteria bacterium]|nr:LysR family transcriptional regulator [Deltaproteobacteria bacterium]
MRWDDLPVFLAALRGGSLASAGALLTVDASTVSRRLKALETALDLRLFDRTPSGLAPTDAALRLRTLAEEAESAIAQLQREGESMEQEVEGEVRIACPDGVATEFMPAVLTVLRERHPALVPTLVCGIAYVDLNRREADLALRTTNPPGDDLITVKLAEGNVGVFGRADLVERWRGAELSEVPFITWDASWAHLADARFLAGIGANVVLRANSLPAHLAAARAGLGFVINVPESSAGLVPLVPDLGVGGALWLTAHRTMRRVPRVNAVWDVVREVFADPSLLEALSRDGAQ